MPNGSVMTATTKHLASPLGSEGCPSCHLITFDVWDERGECPYCGSDDIEIDFDGFYICWNCGLKSADMIVTDGMEKETEMINRLARSGFLDVDWDC